MFFTEKLIAANLSLINDYAGPRFKPITVQKLNAYIGCKLMFGLDGLSQIKQCW